MYPRSILLLGIVVMDTRRWCSQMRQKHHKQHLGNVMTFTTRRGNQKYLRPSSKQHLGNATMFPISLNSVVWNSPQSLLLTRLHLHQKSNKANRSRPQLQVKILIIALLEL